MGGFLTGPGELDAKVHPRSVITYPFKQGWIRGPEETRLKEANEQTMLIVECGMLHEQERKEVHNSEFPMGPLPSEGHPVWGVLPQWDVERIRDSVAQGLEKSNGLFERGG